LQRSMSAKQATKVYFCRHAQSTFNSSGDNSPDVPLSSAGEAQARQLSGHFSLVLCSPMRRAQLTLRLSEITYDRLETVQELREQLNEGSDLLPGEGYEKLGESDASLASRVSQVRNRLLQELADNKSQADFRILVVSHLFTGYALFQACGVRSPDLRNAKIVPLPGLH
uniref:Histidine phosphatase family protein n=2 Tax=Macrostomum lignano TaxID=282301 RepID=A0A1I8GMF0_9PLAT